MLIEKLEYYKIGTGGTSTQTVSGYELAAIVLWLVHAFYNKGIHPLVLRGQVFCYRDAEVIKFLNQDEAMSMDSLIALLKDIATTGELDTLAGVRMWPDISDWHNTAMVLIYRVDVIGSLLNYYDGHNEAILPVSLRLSEDWGHWYAVPNSEQFEGSDFFVTRYRFGNLSAGQL